MSIIGRRTAETIALAAIGDGVMALIKPREHVALWSTGPAWWRRMVEPFERSPGLTRAMGAAGIAFGLWLAMRAEGEAGDEA
jgi:hypothetical protein